MEELGTYERKALLEIGEFKGTDDAGPIGRAIDAVAEGVESVTEAALDTKAGEALTGAVDKIVQYLNEAASWTVDEASVFQEFHNAGHTQIDDLAAIQELDLAEVDSVAAGLPARYEGGAAIEGGLAGAAGAAGIAADVPALTMIALRACNDYAVHYGFDPTQKAEQVFIINLMTTASSASQAAKQIAMSELSRLSVMIGKRQGWQELEKLFTVEVARRAAEMLGVRLTRGKLAQAVPLVGSMVGAGYNAWFLKQVTETARMMYRERFLIEQFGPEVAIGGAAEGGE